MSYSESDFSESSVTSESDYMSEEDSPLKKVPSPKKKKAEPKTTTSKSKSTEKKTKASDSPAKAKAKAPRNIEEEYQKLDQIQHALTRPDMYIGSVEHTTETMWVYDQGQGMVYRPVRLSPGLYKIFDEILVNAADNKQRDPSMKKINVMIDNEKGVISVENDGRPIPVEYHKKEGMYVPELIFGTLLTGNNFNDDVKKTTGGRNGLGAKLANIFSKEFTVVCCDSERSKKFEQKFYDNLSRREQAKITAYHNKTSSTKIIFKPDLSKFSMSELDADIVALMTRRVYDIAGTNPSLKVSLNGEALAVSSFNAYCSLFTQNVAPHPLVAVNPKTAWAHFKSDRWEISVGLSPECEFRQMSFVNSIATTKGGKHVQHVLDKIFKYLVPKVNTKMKSLKRPELKPSQVRNYVFLFVNCLIENPTFSSQTKEEMTLGMASFGSKLEISKEKTPEFFKALDKTGIMDVILASTSDNTKALKKLSGVKKQKVFSVAKLDDANEAGGKNSEDCTLIVTEGDSAKALAISGLSVIGRDHFGVLPLRGKFLNVREASPKQLTENAEIKALCTALGLKIGTKYHTTKGLRYGHLMIMADQDVDGSHIKGLVLNFIHHFWPELFQIPGFLQAFITPVLKATKGRQQKVFYSTPEYEEWKESLDNPDSWKIKYYKGLGTSSSEEAKEYFSHMKEHKIVYKYKDNDDDNAMKKAFGKQIGASDARKDWMADYKPGDHLDTQQKRIQIKDFIDKELILFSIDDCSRSIPSLMDGLKPGQRKILYCCFKRNLRGEVKVAQLAGYVGEHSAYHHGEASLQATIVGMAQNFMGSNNVNLLVPSGQFGTRILGGKDAASSRYIFTKLEKITRKIFRPEDDKILEYLEDDGLSVEPKYYLPIIPMVLVNGSSGIGTGWSSTILNYNPKDLIAALRRRLQIMAKAQKGDSDNTNNNNNNNDDDSAEPKWKPIYPWYRGFQGDLEIEEGGTSVVFKGLYRRMDEKRVEITELPVGTWTASYKEKVLTPLLVGDEKKQPTLSDLKEYHTDITAHFVLEFKENELSKLSDTALEKLLKLSHSLSFSNMVLFDKDCKIKKYPELDDILEEYFTTRYQGYIDRKKLMIDEVTEDLSKISNKVRFIKCVINQEIIIRNRKRQELLGQLEKMKFDKFYDKKHNQTKKSASKTSAAVQKKKKSKDEEDDQSDESDNEDEEEDEEEKQDKTDKSTGYDYLLGMPLWNLTLERVNKLLQQQEKQQEQLDKLRKTPEAEMWNKDLNELEAMLISWFTALEEKESRKPSKKLKGIQQPARRQAKVIHVGSKQKPKRTKAEKGSGDTTVVKRKAASAQPAKQLDDSDIPLTELRTKGNQQKIDAFFGGSKKAKIELESDEEDLMQKKKKKSVLAAPEAPISMEIESDEEDLSQKKKAKIEAPHKNPQPASKKKAFVSSDDDVSVQKSKAKQTTTTTKKKGSTKKNSDSDSDFDDVLVQKSKAKQTTTTTKKKGSSKKISDSDSDDVLVQKSKAKKATTTKKTKVVSNPSEESSDDEEKIPSLMSKLKSKKPSSSSNRMKNDIAKFLTSDSD